MRARARVCMCVCVHLNYKIYWEMDAKMSHEINFSTPSAYTLVREYMIKKEQVIKIH